MASEYVRMYIGAVIYILIMCIYIRMIMAYIRTSDGQIGGAGGADDDAARQHRLFVQPSQTRTDQDRTGQDIQK